MIRKTLLILAVPALAVAGTATAQTAGAPPAGTQAPAADVAPERPVPAQFFEGRGGHEGHGRRGMMGRGGAGAGMMMRLFEEVDADGDGSVTQAEVDAYRATRVGAADGNDDGSLSLDEFQTLWLEQMRPRMVDAFQHLDEDGDGQITEAELDQRVGRMVARLDRDGDGVLTLQDRGRRNR